MSINVYQFNKISHELLEKLTNLIDLADKEELLDVENSGTVLEITNDRATYLITSNQPLRQIWISSPLSGALHFTYNNSDQNWYDTRNNHEFKNFVKKEIKELFNIGIT